MNLRKYPYLTPNARKQVTKRPAQESVDESAVSEMVYTTAKSTAERCHETWGWFVAAMLLNVSLCRPTFFQQL